MNAAQRTATYLAIHIKLQKEHCQSCGCEVKVTSVSPNNNPQITGIWLRSMDSDFNHHNLGHLCKECASILCDLGEISLGFSGGYVDELDNWEALITPTIPNKELTNRNNKLGEEK